MSTKKSFNIYYLLLAEGTTEFNLFAYLTRNRYKQLFEKSTIKFSNKVEIADKEISGGKLNGAGNLSSFKSKFDSIKNDTRYDGQTLFFILDKDLDDSADIEKLIKSKNDIVQFVEYSSEHLLLRFGGKNPKNPTDFNNMVDFRNYCKNEFQNQFNKKASEFKDADFEAIFSGVNDEEIKGTFVELFSTITE